MLNLIDCYLLANVPTVVNLQKMESTTVKQRVQTAISRFETASLDHYDAISILSVYWASDDTGSKDDSSLFLKTTSKLETEKTKVATRARVIADEERVWPLVNEMLDQVGSMTGKRQLFILHYAGHAVATSTSSHLILTPRIAQGEFVGPQINMTLVKDALKDLATTSPGLDILLLLDCCCAAIAGRGPATNGERVELMAATSGGGLSNSRLDGKTFTQHWCQAFDMFLERKQPFCCNDIEIAINSDFNLEQFPATFVLCDGWGVPITFRAPPLSTTSAPEVTTKTVITALHVVESPGSNAMDLLIEYLQNAPADITILAALPISSTLLLLRVPVYLQEMLELPRVALILTDV